MVKPTSSLCGICKLRTHARTHCFLLLPQGFDVTLNKKNKCACWCFVSQRERREWHVSLATEMCDSKTVTSCPSRGALRTQIERSAKENICIVYALFLNSERHKTKTFQLEPTQRGTLLQRCPPGTSDRATVGLNVCVDGEQTMLLMR